MEGVAEQPRTGIYNKNAMAAFAAKCRAQRLAKITGGEEKERAAPVPKVVHLMPAEEVAPQMTREAAICEEVISKYIDPIVSRLFPNEEGIATSVVFEEAGSKFTSELRSELKTSLHLNRVSPRKKSHAYKRRTKKVIKLLKEAQMMWRQEIGELVYLKKASLVQKDVRFLSLMERNDTDFYYQYLDGLLHGFLYSCDDGPANLSQLVERIGVSRQEYIKKVGTKLIQLIKQTTTYKVGRGKYERLSAKIRRIREAFLDKPESKEGARAGAIAKCDGWQKTLDGFVSITPRKAQYIEVIQDILDTRTGLTPFDEEALFEKSTDRISELFELWVAFTNDEASIVDSVACMIKLI